MTILAIILAWVGIVLFGSSVLGLNNEIENKDQSGRTPIRIMSRIAIILMTLGALLAIADTADAQVQMWPGQEIKFCNGIGAISGGGITCAHDVAERRAEFTFMNAAFHTTFWGDGTAAALLPPLCRINGIDRVTETVFEPGLVRVRTMTCSTGKSGPWIVVEVPES
jgi:hypothetical protein